MIVLSLAVVAKSLEVMPRLVVVVVDLMRLVLELATDLLGDVDMVVFVLQNCPQKILMLNWISTT